MKKIIYTSSLLSVILISACGSHTVKETDEQAPAQQTNIPKDTTPNTASDETVFKFDFAVANIPSPAKIINEFAQNGAQYNNTLLNDAAKAKSYTADFDKAINLGIYNLDMSYAIAHSQSADVMKYFKTAMVEADALGLKAALGDAIGQRAQNNISNKDSLFKLIDQLYSQSDKYLRSNQRVETATYIFIGSWVEALNIICQTGLAQTDAAQVQKTHQHLWDQRLYIKNLLDLLAEFKTADSKKLSESLNKICSQITAIKQAKDIDDKTFADISEKIKNLRNTLSHN